MSKILYEIGLVHSKTKIGNLHINKNGQDGLLTGLYLVALALMIAGTVFTVADTIIHSHVHKHHHFLTHTHDGSTHTHEIIHSHLHNHYVSDNRHGHHHSREMLEKELQEQH